VQVAGQVREREAAAGRQRRRELADQAARRHLVHAVFLGQAGADVEELGDAGS